MAEIAEKDFALLKQRVEDLDELVSDHDKLLVRGNGQPSLKDEIRRLSKFVEEEKDSRKYYSRLVISAMIGNAITFVIGGLIWFLRVLPAIEQVVRLADK